ncbi:MAG: hypothetical protein NT106_01500 [Candidatus Sumerlaeota bacterium]|jgi:hypothetical protein|nr:hypothetical protein [Candidatus Sumerlaeota bacterium]
MKKEYDFSGGVRGKFYKPDVKLNLPIYLDQEVLAFIESIASKRESDISSVVNEILRSDMRLSKTMK